MHRTERDRTTERPRLWREPTLHFFLLALLLFVAHRLVVGDQRTIVLTPALKADILRRYQDQMGHKPDAAEVAAVLNAWKVDEALYREALQLGLEREDPTVRNVLISKMRERATLEARIPEPTESDLQQYLEQHRDQYEAPWTYEHEYVVFSKSEPGAEQKRAEAERQLQAGATPASLGLRSTGANVDRARIEQEFGPSVADAICKLAPGGWHELETPDRLLLVRMIGKQGGLPPAEVLHAQLEAGWRLGMTEKATARAARAIADRYRFEEPSR